MNIIQRSKMAVLAALLCAGGAHAATTNLIGNGNFEIVDPSLAFGSGYHVVGNGSTGIADWTVGATSIDLIKNAYNAINGYSIDMLGTPGPGMLSQNFNVMAGKTYFLSFDMARNSNGPSGQGVAVNFGGAAQSFYSTSPNAATVYNFANTMSFTALSTGVATLSFASSAKLGTSYDNYSGAVIDNVTVTAVPEPEAYAMLMLGLGLVGFMSRRKKTAA